jgi:hypothetical protein
MKIIRYQFLGKLVILFLLFSAVFSTENSVLKAGKAKSEGKKSSSGAIDPDFYRETLNFHIKWKFIKVGKVVMKTEVDEKTNLVNTFARVNSTKYMQKIYYVQGTFGCKWNYKTQRPVSAFEEIYQGKIYKKRSYHFKGDKVLVQKIEKYFKEYSWPHKLRKRPKKRKKWLKAPGYLDVLSSFHYVRSTKTAPKVGEIKRIPILPAGQMKYLILKVLEKKKIKIPFLGIKEVFVVRSAIASKKRGKTQSGTKLFFRTKSNVYMWITADGYIPVKLWTEIPYLGKVELILDKITKPEK